MRRQKQGNTANRLSLALGVMMLLGLMMPAPGGTSQGAGSRVFSVVGSDYLSPLISSARAIQTLNGRLSAYAQFAGYDQSRAFVCRGQGPELASVTRYCGEIFSILRAEFVARQRPSGEAQPAYISECFWQAAFHGDPGVLGQILTIGHDRYEIAGILRMPANPLSETEVWVPLRSRGPYGTMTALRVIGELRPGAGWREGEKGLAEMMRDDVIQEQVVEAGTVRLLPVEKRLVLRSRPGAQPG